jgi:AraC family transcriptional regulator
MSNLTSMYRAVQFIEQHLREPMTVQNVADTVDYSLYHFCRTFNSVIGHSPYDYIIRRRLSESARELLSSERKIIDIALDYQFNNPETYTRAFRRMFGVPPSQARKNQALTRLMFKSRVTLAYIEYINRGDLRKPRRVESQAIHLVGLVAVRDETNLGDTWTQLRAKSESIANRFSPEKYSPVANVPSVEGPSWHMVGIEVASLAGIPPAWVGKTIPPLTYACFMHQGQVADVGLSLDYIYQTWLPQSGYTLASPFEIECWPAANFGLNDAPPPSELLIAIN